MTSRAGWDEFDDEKIVDVCMKSITLTNYVARVELNVTNIDLRRLAQTYCGAISNLPAFPVILFSQSHPMTTCSVYRTGRITFMGAKNPCEAVHAAHKHIRILNAYLPSATPMRMLTMNIDNIVACVLTFPVYLEKMVQQRSDVMRYDAKKFSGASLACAGLNIPTLKDINLKKTRISMEIFKSGNVIITAIQSLAELQVVMRWVIENVLLPMRIKRGEAFPACEDDPLAIARLRSGASAEDDGDDDDGDYMSTDGDDDGFKFTTDEFAHHDEEDEVTRLREAHELALAMKELAE